MVNEKSFLELSWQYKLLGNTTLRLVDGRQIEVLSSGYRSSGQKGEVPEFVFAQVRFVDSGIIMHGSVRVDTLSSDWRRQQQVGRSAFDGVVLHFVGECDSVVIHNGVEVPTLCAPRIDYLRDNASRVAGECHGYIAQLDEVHREQILSRMASERLERKSGEVLALLPSVNGNWHKLAVQFLIMSFGYRSSKKPFAQLAQLSPIDAIVGDMVDRESLEAIFLGLSGFLDQGAVLDGFGWQLSERYLELASSFGLSGRVSLRGNYRLRPQSNPQLQLARLAAILGENGSFWDRLLGSVDYFDVREIFRGSLGSYWHTHLMLGVECSRGATALSRARVDGLIINFVVPLLHAYGQWLGDEDIKERAIDFLIATSAEENTLITKWKSEGCRPMNSYQTQALLEISKMFCAAGGSRCFECPVGGSIVVDYYRRYSHGMGFSDNNQ